MNSFEITKVTQGGWGGVIAAAFTPSRRLDEVYITADPVAVRNVGGIGAVVPDVLQFTRTNSHLLNHNNIHGLLWTSLMH